ncbi:MAG: hypothetical protein WDN50_12680 [Bradyrhizobium sp.]
MAVVAGLTSSSLLAQGTMAQRQACTPDVFRLCSAFIPDAVSITACLKRQSTDLSEECRKVMFPAARPDDASIRSDLRWRPAK